MICTAHYILHTMCCIPCTPLSYYILCTAYYVLHTMCCILHTTYHKLHITYYVLHTMYSYYITGLAAYYILHSKYYILRIALPYHLLCTAYYVYVLYTTLDEFKKFAILKKGIGIEGQNQCKQFNDQKLYKQDGTQLLL